MNMLLNTRLKMIFVDFPSASLFWSNYCASKLYTAAFAMNTLFVFFVKLAIDGNRLGDSCEVLDQS